MNILLVPSWYPSPTDSVPGAFVKEQALMLARYFPQHRFGICTWGQNDDRFLLHLAQPQQALSAGGGIAKHYPLSSTCSPTWWSTLAQHLHGHVLYFMET
ncbi:MAG: hypothetical protein HC842_05520 [Cytophagales bacterium]|nr:hypothetical protein [Cytophagales bacterium]